MRSSSIRIVGPAVVCCILFASAALAADQPAAKAAEKSATGAAGAAGADEAAMMQKWQAFMTPGDAHKMLAERVGNWNAKVSVFAAPGAPPAVSDGTCEIKSMLDGRYFEDTTHGNMMGMPFEGHGVTGYDNMKKKYVSTWIDNMGTGIMLMEGAYDPATKTMTFTGSGPDVVSGAYKPMKMTDKTVSADAHTMEMFQKGPDGKSWVKSMEIEYTRAK